MLYILSIRNDYELLLFFLLSFVCLSSHAQETIYTLEYDGSVITLQQLKNTSWHLSNSKKITWYKNAKQICT